MPLHQPPLPFMGVTSISRHCSYQAAVRASHGRGAKAAQYLAWLRSAGPATDKSAAEYSRWPLSSITSIRNGLLQRELVAAVGSCPGPRTRLTLWGAR